MEKKKTTTKPRKKTGSTTSKAANSKAKTATLEEIRRKNQINSVVLFFSAILLLFIIFIRGEVLWLGLHNIVTGLMGYWSLLVPLIMIYEAIRMAMEKPTHGNKKRLSLSIITILFITACVHIWTPVIIPEDADFFSAIGYLFTSGTEAKSAGIVGATLGVPMGWLLGDIGARIVSIIVLIVSVLIFTRSDLIRLYNMFAKPSKAVAKQINTAKQRRDAEREILNEARENGNYNGSFRIHNITPTPTSNNLSPSKPLDRLQKSFGIGSKKQVVEKEVYTEENLPLLEGDDINTESLDALLNDVDKADDITELLHKKSNEMHGAKVEKPVEKAKTTEIRTATPVISQTATKVDTPKDVLDNVAKAAEDFIKRREQAEKLEIAQTAQMALYEEAKNSVKSYIFPPITMLAEASRSNVALETQELQNNAQKLVDTLKSFGVETKIIDICRGPSVTRYELQPAAGVKISKITNLSDDIALNLAAVGVRIEAPIPGKAAVGIEIPNKNKTVVRMRELIESNPFLTSKSNLSVVLGRDIAGDVKIADLAKMPHMLIAGTTGSGKSVCINSLIISLMYKSSPEDVRFLMIDPKVVELGIYNGIPHLLVPVVTDPRKAAGALSWAVTEMLNRYKIFAEYNVKDLAGYNHFAKVNNYMSDDGQPIVKMPQIVMIIDELADLMMAAPNDVEDSICRLAQMARAAGMHLVVATQRPTVDVVTGLIKANIPSRIAFAVSSSTDSRTILDSQGAEKLLGQGDMLYSPVGAHKPLRIQGCFVTESEIEKIVEFVKGNRMAEYDEKIIEDIEKNAVQDNSKTEKAELSENTDPMLDEAIKCVIEAGQASTSLLQRRLRLGYARAGRLIDEMEILGIVGPHEGSKPRQVIMTYSQYLERNMQKSDDVVPDVATEIVTEIIANEEE